MSPDSTPSTVDLVATTIAEHAITRTRFAYTVLGDAYSWRCQCGAGTDTPSLWAQMDAAVQHHLAESIVAALAGRVMPEGGETREERGVVAVVEGHPMEFHHCTAWATCTQYFPHFHRHTRTVTEWPDRTLTTAWTAVPDA